MKHVNLFYLMLSLVVAQVTAAETIQGLLDAGKLEARAVVKTPAPHFQKAPVEIVVEVGTPDRFNGSIRVRDFTVPATLVRRMTKTAFNETRRRDGVSWDFQSWRFELHAERSGPLRVPPLTTFISIKSETDGDVKGELKLTVPPIQIEVPPGTEALDSWVAANEFKVEESWEGVLEKYQVGDAVTRIRKFTISGSPAMAIPASPRIELDGVQVYQAPPLVDDKEVGGKLQGIREERVVFTFKGGGAFTIPEEQIHWLNLKTKTVDKIDLPGRDFEVSGPPVSSSATQTTSESKGDSKGTFYTMLSVAAAVVIWLGYLLFRRMRWSIRFSPMRDRLESLRRQRRARAAFMHAAEQQDSQRCLELLYQQMSEHAEWQLSTAFANDPQKQATSDALMAHAFGGGQPPEVSEVQGLWVLSKGQKLKQESANTLQLNPGPYRPKISPIKTNS
ncbi:BatD family protein [Verrucomicrobiaceae bacterium N1E253]|uniref:BatD family protein n=1 Tax=Oceaniferula marina TaxID=2748318 RepID=A0A851GMH5_9BACT|nr:BatD family protein [Oceaniferula marina]NWK57041.1 BatD family protein [Oceaniferula marina]